MQIKIPCFVSADNQFQTIYSFYIHSWIWKHQLIEVISRSQSTDQGWQGEVGSNCTGLPVAFSFKNKMKGKQNKIKIDVFVSVNWRNFLSFFFFSFSSLNSSLVKPVPCIEKKKSNKIKSENGEVTKSFNNKKKKIPQPKMKVTELSNICSRSGFFLFCFVTEVENISNFPKQIIFLFSHLSFISVNQVENY